MNSNFYKKYLKYKRKYLYLKNQVGGSIIYKDCLRTIRDILEFNTFIRNPKKSKNECKKEEILSRIIGNKIIIDKDGVSTFYTISKFLGKGGFGCVFKIRNDTDNKFYVIKFGFTSPNEEAKTLEELMRDIVPKCNYKAITYGSIRINGENVYFIIFNFKGDIDLFKFLVKGENCKFIPNYIKDILTCLIEINKKGYHADLKTENIAIDESNTASIIDYGLSKTYTQKIITIPMEIENLTAGIRDDEISDIGIVQTSIDLLIFFLMRDTKIELFNNLYACYIEIMLHTFDNFGLFWLIINCFYMNKFIEIIGKNYISFMSIQQTEYTKKIYIELYFNLNPPITDFEISILTAVGITIDPLFRTEFIESIRLKLKTDKKFDLIFRTDENYTSFMNLLLGIIRVDPSQRTSLVDLLQHPIFQ